MIEAPPTMSIRGVHVWQEWLSKEKQTKILDDIRTVVAKAPFFVPITPSGKKMSVLMTSAGRMGWVTDSMGYRYEPKHPSGVPWPEIPRSVLKVWENLLE